MHSEETANRCWENFRNFYSIFKLDSCAKKKQHYFESKIEHCFSSVNMKISNDPSTYFAYKNGLCVGIIEEIEFANDTEADENFQILRREEEHVRKLERTFFGDICFEVRSEQFYYAVRQGNVVFLLSDGDSYNYKYKRPLNSIDRIIEEDQTTGNEIIFDDIYSMIKND